MSNPKCRDNLKPFVKGDPRRINKPKGAISMSTLLRKFAEAKSKIDINPITQEKVNKLTAKEVVVLQLWTKGMKGDLNAIKEILDRLEGKVKENIEHSGQIDGVGKLLIIRSDESIEDKTKTIPG